MCGIDGARARSIPWVIVGMHEHCLGVGHACEIGPDLVNLLTAKKVDLILQAHDHDYQRGKQLALGPACLAVLDALFAAGWTWLSGPGAVVSLTAGRHTIRLLRGAAGVDLDRILLTANLNAPG